MNILLIGRHHGYFRSYESVIRMLAAHGHHLHLAAERDESIGGRRLVETIARECPTVTFGEAPARAADDHAWALGRVRLGLDYLRYQHPIFDDAGKLRARSRERTPGGFVALGRAVRAAGEWSRQAASRWLRQVEQAVPEDPAVSRFIDEQRPDVLLLTPLIDLGSSQIDYLRAARCRGIPTALCVWSWDHLSSKALIRECPDRVFVWNGTQKREAMELHDVPADRVVVTGAQSFDQWFGRAPSRDRATFCRTVGLTPERPILLYVCSALFGGSPVEAGFVVEWIRQVRSSTRPAVRDAAILIRPHPSRTAEWNAVDVSSLDAVVWGSNPVDAQARDDYFDSLHHSAAVIGINTSAFIEAAIVGRSVHTVILPELQENQTGTVHFRYLLETNGGPLHVAHAFDEHLRQLDAALATPQQAPLPFVREFVRPHGLERAATPLFVERVEAMQDIAVEPVPASWTTPLWRATLRLIGRTRRSAALERWTLSERELEHAGHLRDERRRKAFRRARERAHGDAERLQEIERRAAAFEAQGVDRMAK